MNEQEKNIETCLAESILAEVASVPQDPQFRSLVNESLDPLKQQAAAQAGDEAYEKIVWTHWPYTFTSSVRQMKSNLILLLRRLWRFPFGRGTIRSFADMWSHYITRLSGNPEYGIPSRLSSLTDLPSAPALLSDRKIGGADVADGMSLVQILCNTERWNAITELVDDNIGWLYDRPITFPNSLNKLVLGMGIVRRTTTGSSLSFNGTHFAIPHLTLIDHSATNNNVCFSIPNVEDVDARSLTELQQHYSTAGSTLGQIFSGTNIKKIDTNLAKFQYGWNVDYYVFCPSPNLQCLKVGKPVNFQPTIFYYQGTYTVPNRGAQKTFEKLIRLEFGQDTDISLNLSPWNPSYVLSDNPTGTDLIEEGSTAANNLQQFLQNFKTYIAERLTDNGSGLTLTLSQAVRNAIHAAESTYGIENIIITQKGWTISPAPN